MNGVRAWIARHRRGLVAAAAAVLVAVQSTGAASRTEYVATLAVAVLGAVATYVVPDLEADGYAWVKPAVMFLFAGAQVAVQLADGGIHGAEWLTIAVQALGAVGVLVPNRPPASSPAVQIPRTVG